MRDGTPEVVLKVAATRVVGAVMREGVAVCLVETNP